MLNSGHQTPGGDFFRVMTFWYSRYIIYDYNKSSLTLKKYQLNQRLILKCFKMKVGLPQQIQVQSKSFKILENPTTTTDNERAKNQFGHPRNKRSWAQDQMQTSIKYIPHGTYPISIYILTNESDKYHANTVVDSLFTTYVWILQISFSISFCNEIFCIGANGNVITIII